MFTRWSSELLTGNEVIDKQHQRIFERAEEMIGSTTKGKTKQEAIELIDYLEGYYYSHFAAEEALQIKHKDPNHVAHKEMHENLRREVAQLKQEVIASGATYAVAIKTVLFMLEWLAEHIGKVDKGLAAHIRNVQSSGPAPVPHLRAS